MLAILIKIKTMKRSYGVNFSTSRIYRQVVEFHHPNELIPPKNQWKEFFASLSKSIFDELLSSSGLTDRARLLASSTEPSSKWLQFHTPIMTPLGQRLSTNCSSWATQSAIQTAITDYHAWKLMESMHVMMNWTRFIRWYSALLGCSIVSNLTSYPWSRCRSLIWNVMVVHSIENTYVGATSLASGSAADQPERKKHKNYVDFGNT